MTTELHTDFYWYKFVTIYSLKFWCFWYFLQLSLSLKLGPVFPETVYYLIYNKQSSTYVLS